ncbi:unnamed protein product [Onchocerca ochengi]|uniref:Ig-like domain-containing protein n=2 Tax=Onchocerca TaxID=6281 RepID=A0A182EIK9_ONCOC|nr:unnamed protein product [Onchocerca ochengi]
MIAISSPPSNSSYDTTYNEPLSKVPVRKCSAFLRPMIAKNRKNASKRWWRDENNDKKSKNLDVGLASPSISHHSREFDDLFEFYSEDDNRNRRNSKKRSNLQNELKVSSLANLKENFTNNMIKLRRKDLEFDEFIHQKMSNSSESDDNHRKVHEEDETRRSKIALVLEMKLKISDKQVKCSAYTRIGEETVVVTCAGNYGDMESILKWTIDGKVEDGRELWVNDPVSDASGWDARRLRMISDVTFRH